MDRHRTPRPTSDLTTAAAELSAKQREVFGALQQFPQGAQVTELAKELGMHINTVRGHLDELIAHGLVVRRQARTTGRGRPSHIFTARVARNADVTSEYVELVDMLATAIAGDDLERALHVALDAFRGLLARAPRLSEDQEIGLFGELVALDRLIDGVGETKALAAWLGPRACLLYTSPSPRD